MTFNFVKSQKQFFLSLVWSTRLITFPVKTAIVVLERDEVTWRKEKFITSRSDTMRVSM